MEKSFSRPKQFGEILDHVFQLIKNNFGKLFLLVLAFYSPIILLQAFIQISSGQGLIRDLSPGDNFFEQIFNTIADFSEVATPVELSGNFLIGLLNLLIYPLAFASVFLVIKQIKSRQIPDVKQATKEAFSRFWPLLGSYVLFSILIVFITAIPITIVIATAFTSFAADNLVLGILSILMIFPIILGIVLLVTRWIFFIPITIEDSAPGIGASFRLTKGRTWMTFFIFLTLMLVNGTIATAFEFFVLFLGYSVLYVLIINLVSVFTSVIFFVGFSVVYFDLQVRQSGSDLKQMIDEYQPSTEIQS